ncbi:MAG TPA: hypothetical protein EYG85_05295 [Crocinitomix sp.]|nr:hypothetical protein [Crocinitomix sp.]
MKTFFDNTTKTLTITECNDPTINPIFDEDTVLNIILDKYIESVKLIFEDCTFNQINILTTKKEFIFQDCTIKSTLKLPDFNKNIYFENCHLNKITSYIKMHGGSIKKLHLVNRHFKEKFYINEDELRQDSNNYQDPCIKSIVIHELIINKVSFEKTFKLSCCIIKSILQIEKVNFKSNAYFSGCSFGKENTHEILFKGITFQELSFFNKTTFYKKLIFRKVTFGNLVSFLDSNFSAGLNLDDVTRKKEMNFARSQGLESDISLQNTTKETYRIIKYNFNKLKNQIDTNKFHALELTANLNEIQTSRKNIIKKHNIKEPTWLFGLINNEYRQNLSDNIIQRIHKSSSNFGTSWTKALRNIIIVGFTTYILFVLVSNGGILNKITYANILYKVQSYGFFESLAKFTHEGIKFMSLFYSNDTIKYFFEKSPIIFLLHKGFLGYLYYQFIVAVRKDTKK